MKIRSTFFAVLSILLITSASTQAAPRAREGGKDLVREKSREVRDAAQDSMERRGSTHDQVTSDVGLPNNALMGTEDAEFVGPKATPTQFQSSVLETLNEIRARPENSEAAVAAIDAIQSNPNAISVVAPGWMTTCQNLSAEALNNGLKVIAEGAKNISLAKNTVYEKGLSLYKELTGQGKESYCQLRQGQQCPLFAGKLVAGCI